MPEMEADSETRSGVDLDVKMEDAPATLKSVEGKPTYKSWKKKYRKMRIAFDQKMHKCEDLYKSEQKALDTARRLAIENDRLLDLLLDVNNSAQIPPEKRFDISLDPADPKSDLVVDIDVDRLSFTDLKPGKSLQNLLREVPHVRFAAASDAFAKQLEDLDAGRDSPADPAQGTSHPPTFLAADDLDSYIWEVDRRIAASAAAATNGAGSGKHANGISAKRARALSPLPSLAPLAQSGGSSSLRDSALNQSRDAALRNPTSVYNWLRKHAPKTFLQDAEGGGGGGGGGADKENGVHGADDRHGTPVHGGAQGAREKATGRGRGDRASAAGKAASARAMRKAAAAAAESMDYDDEMALDSGTPDGGGAAAKGKRKRQADDDGGYRPKGGSSRPTKRKRKSEGGDGVSMPTPAVAKRAVARKSAGGDGGSARKSAGGKAQKEREREREQEAGTEPEPEPEQELKPEKEEKEIEVEPPKAKAAAEDGDAV